MVHLFLPGEEEEGGERPSGVPGRRLRLPVTLRRRRQDVQEVWAGGTRHEHVHRPPHVRTSQGEALAWSVSQPSRAQ